MAETIYAVGTVSVSNGGTTVTGAGTSWQGKIFEGDLFTDPAQGIFARVTADATSNTSLSINAWPGTALSGDAYEILLMPDSVRASERTRQLLEQLSVVQANGRGLFYLFSDTTTDADPGAGYIRINNADPALATAAYIDVLDANGATVSGEIDTWDDSTSLGKGNVWVRGIADPSAFHAYELTGSVVDGTGYRKLTLTYIGGSGSFAADDELMVAFARTGDTGEGYVTDATVADPSELTALEGEAAGYLVFVTDLQTDFGAYSGRSGVVELVAGPDWALVAIYTGPQGIQGPPGGTGPTGPKGINWQGDYSGATAYVEDDGVLYNGSSWRALGATTGNAPPTLPTTSNTWWELIARAGTDGAGTVSSIAAGDGISVDNTDPTSPVVSVDFAAVAEDILPDTDSTRDLGSASKAWAEVHADLVAAPALKFPATAIPSSDPNTLDDYEENTFTPVVEGTSTAGTGTYTQQQGRYTKTGREVSFEINVAWSAHTGTGNLIISGLPFTSSGSGIVVPATVVASSLTFSGQLIGQVPSNSTQVQIRTISSGVGLGDVAMDTAATLFISGKYTV